MKKRITLSLTEKDIKATLLYVARSLAHEKAIEVETKTKRSTEPKMLDFKT